MRSREEVLAKFQELYSKYLGELVAEYTSKDPINCRHNHRHRVKNFGSVGFCNNQKVLLGSKQFVFVCSDKDTAQKCPYFCCKNTEESVLSVYKNILKNPALCGQRFPKLAVLIWFLQTPPPSREKRQRFAKLLVGIFVNLWRIFSFSWW